jgi:hypothetical protein
LKYAAGPDDTCTIDQTMNIAESPFSGLFSGLLEWQTVEAGRGHLPYSFIGSRDAKCRACLRYRLASGAACPASTISTRLYMVKTELEKWPDISEKGIRAKLFH